MNEAHPIFTQPENEEVRVWRYMNFTKFVSLIDSKCLYFTRADKFDDPFEGSWPKMNVMARQIVPEEIPEKARENFLLHMGNLSNINRNLPKFNAINCWHMNEHESAAMWILYSKTDEGIAVQSTYRKLKNSISNDEKIFLGLVNYIDYEIEWIDAGNLLSPFVNKRKSFEHEKEIRGVITKWPTEENAFDFSKETIKEGIKLPVDLERLIENIYVAPNAEAWFADLVRAVIQQYGYSFPVVHSRLDEKPVF